MKKTLTAAVAIVLGLGLTACGGNSPTVTPSIPAATQSAALDYQTIGADVSGVIAQYRAAAGTVQDVTSCQSVEAAYQATMGPLVDRMYASSAAMDQFASAASGPASADMACVASAMKAEFARHVVAACAVPDLTANRAEQAQHATTMAGWADHQRVRYEQMGYAMGMMPYTADTTWACAHNADGNYTMNGSTWTSPQGTTPTTPPPAPPMPSPGTATPGQGSWPMPCGGTSCPCNGNGYPPSPTPTPTPTPSPTPIPSPTPTPPPSGDPLSLGQRIFFSGIGVNGAPLSRTGGYGMIMTSGCASCHGVDGHGLRMMMFTTPNITYANLTNPAGMLDPDGTRGSTYTDDLIRRAVTQGIDADGAPLSTIMPHWQLGDEDWNDLLLFLKTLP